MANAMTAGKAVFMGSNTQLRARQSSGAVARAPVVVRAQQQQDIARRSSLGLLAGAAALLARTGSSQAAFGDAANVFGKATNTTGYVPYQGEGYALLIPSKWNPSREQEFPGTVLRYEDNGDAVNNVTVLVKPAGKNSIKDFGDPQSFLNDISFLFGDQSFFGQTVSEGGFKPNKVSAVSLLDFGAREKDGKTYYEYELLSRTADGDEGGRHALISAAVNNGSLYILKIQVGDKRWFKGSEKFARGAWNSFKVA